MLGNISCFMDMQQIQWQKFASQQLATDCAMTFRVDYRYGSCHITESQQHADTGLQSTRPLPTRPQVKSSPSQLVPKATWPWP